MISTLVKEKQHIKPLGVSLDKLVLKHYIVRVNYFPDICLENQSIDRLW